MAVQSCTRAISPIACLPHAPPLEAVCDVFAGAKMSGGLQIGNLDLDVPFYQAPLSGYSDRAMRRLARRFGCPLTFTGVLLDKVALHRGAMRKLHLQPVPDESPVGAQILGADPQTMAQAAAVLEQVGFCAIDLNFACPAPKVLRRGRGGALLDHPRRIMEIYKRVRDMVSLPVLVKLRIGVDGGPASRECFWEICERLAGERPDAIVIHGRTVGKMYRGKADWTILGEVKQRFADQIIIGSGDLMTPQDVAQRIHTSGLDGVAIARGAIGNPWIYRDCRVLLAGQAPAPPPTLEEVAEVMLQHLEWILELYPERKAVPFFRKFAAHYSKRHPRRKAALPDLMAAKTAEQVRQAIRHWFNDQAEECPA